MKPFPQTSSRFSVWRPSLSEMRKDMFRLRRPVGAALMLLFCLSLFASPVMAQSGNVDFFSGIGWRVKALFCAFLDSPIVPVVLGISLAIVMLMIVFGDENSGSSKGLKAVAIGVAVMFLPTIIGWMGWHGFEDSCLTNFSM